MFKFATRLTENQMTLVVVILAISAVAFVNLLVLAALSMVPVWPVLVTGLMVVVSAYTLTLAVALRD